MPWFEFDLMDGKKPVGFSLNANDSSRFVAFMAECQGYRDALRDSRSLTRELDVLLNGEAGAAQQASLCDVVAQVRRQGTRIAPPSTEAGK